MLKNKNSKENPAKYSLADNSLYCLKQIWQHRKSLLFLNIATIPLDTLSGLLNNSTEVGSVKVVSASVEDMSMDALRSMGDSIKEKNAAMVAVLAAVNDGKINFLCVCGADAVKAGAHAGKIVKEVAKICQGGGGGRPDSATAGGKDVSKLADALAAVNEIVGTFVK